MSAGTPVFVVPAVWARTANAASMGFTQGSELEDAMTGMLVAGFFDQRHEAGPWRRS